MDAPDDSGEEVPATLYRLGMSRHGAPVPNRHTMPFSTVR